LGRFHWPSRPAQNSVSPSGPGDYPARPLSLSISLTPLCSPLSNMHACVEATALAMRRLPAGHVRVLPHASMAPPLPPPTNLLFCDVVPLTCAPQQLTLALFRFQSPSQFSGSRAHDRFSSMPMTTTRPHALLPRRCPPSTRFLH
jgi:hypothetical protein